MNTGGNVGSAAWMMAENVFNCKNIALLGMDFGYYKEHLSVLHNITMYYLKFVKINQKSETFIQRYIIKNLKKILF